MISIDDLPKTRGSYRHNADLSKTTWFGVGGVAEILFKPEDIDDLCKFISELDKSIPYKVIGVGSNILVRDGGFNGVVIRLGRAFTDLSVENNMIRAGAAVSDYNFANFAMGSGFGGAEFLIGVPGLIGGGIFMNCGCYGREISEIISYVKIIDESGNLIKLDRDQIDFQYRTSNLPSSAIIVEAGFTAVSEDSSIIKSRMEQISRQRQESQPIKEKTGGSTFKNPVAYKAWELIDKAGFRGYKLGGAMVSEQHCNFLINTGNATASDIEDLGELIRENVKKKFGVDLEWEIKILGRK